jgi:hypothetical protein
MTRDEKLELAAKIEGSYRAIEELIEGLPPEALRFKPPIEGAWSINDFLVHFLDADVSLNFRARISIAEPGAAAPAWDEEAWQGTLRYDAQDGRACLTLAKGIRSFLASTMRALADEDWSSWHFIHSSKGRMGFVDLVGVYRDHVAFHAALIKRNRDAWKALNRGDGSATGPGAP